MKRFLSLIALGVYAIYAWGEGVPAFDKGAVLDCGGEGNLPIKKIELINLTTYTPYMIKLYGYNEKEMTWDALGTLFFREYKDDDALSTKKIGKALGSYRYFGAESNAAGGVLFDPPVREKKENIYITVRADKDSPATQEEQSDTKSEGDFLGETVDIGYARVFDEIEFHDLTKTGPHQIKAYGKDEQRGVWVYIKTIFLKKQGDEDEIESEEIFPIGAFRYLGLETAGGAHLKFSIGQKKKKDKIKILVTE